MNKSQIIDNTIIPKPVSFNKKDNNYTLNKDRKIYIEGNYEGEEEAINNIGIYLRDKLKPSTGFNFEIVKGTVEDKKIW